MDKVDKFKKRLDTAVPVSIAVNVIMYIKVPEKKNRGIKRRPALLQVPGGRFIWLDLECGEQPEVY